MEEKGSFKGRRMPKRIIQKGRAFALRSDGRYLAEDDGTTLLETFIVLALLSGDGPTHGCRIDQSAGFIADSELGSMDTSAVVESD